MRRRGPSVGVASGLVLALALATATTLGGGGSPMASAGGTEDLTNLPIGTAVTQTPQVGAVDSCQSSFNGQGARAFGDWIHGDGTFDLTAKPHVDGNVEWDGQFAVSLHGTNRRIEGNALPDHTTGTFPIAQSDDAYEFDTNPNTIRSGTIFTNIPARPGLAATPACTGLGRIGWLLSGSYLFNALDAEGRDAVAYEIQDSCNGHPERSGAYHYHSITSCIDDPQTGEHSQLVGYAADGFGIYGHYGDGGVTLTDADLDECHGHVGTILWDGVPRVMYHYHATWEYPYTIGCYRGQALATAPTNCNLAPPDNDFTDVASSASYVDAVDWAECNALVTGTAFRPTSGLKRKQAVVLLWRFMGSPSGSAVSSYPDVTAGASYHDALDWATDEGIFTPGASGLFKPATPLTRSQWMTWLWHLLGDPAGDADTTYPDVPAGASYHDAVDWGAAHDVFTPYGDGTFRPTSTVKRSQALSWLSALAASVSAWADFSGTRPDTLRQL